MHALVDSDDLIPIFLALRILRIYGKDEAAERKARPVFEGRVELICATDDLLLELHSALHVSLLDLRVLRRFLQFRGICIEALSQLTHVAVVPGDLRKR